MSIVFICTLFGSCSVPTLTQFPPNQFQPDQFPLESIPVWIISHLIKSQPNQFPPNQFCASTLHSITFARRVIFADCQFCLGVTFARVITFLWLHFSQSVLFAWHQIFTGAIFCTSRSWLVFFQKFDKMDEIYLNTLKEN